MILYFADRFMNILGSANTALPKGIKIKDDLKTEEVDTGIASFEFALPFDKETRAKIEGFLKAGNYILRSNEDENEFYTIVDGEIDTRSKDIYVYAEDAGLDLLNEIVGEYEASHAYPIEHYIEKFAKDSGFVIGINEIEDKSLQLSFDNEETATARIANVAALFGAEISYSFKVEGLKVVNKLINVHEKRGKDNGRQLRLNKELDRIVTKYSITNLATALIVEGGTPDDAENPITLKGYSYDDGDFYVSGKRLYSREALDNWSRYLWSDEPNQLSGYEGHIVKTFSSNALTQKELCDEAIAELKKLREVEVNYEIEFNQKPENVSIGDRVNVIDDEGELYLSTRLLKLETSVVNETFKATLGEFLLKDSGISSKVEQLAADFAKNSVDVKNAYIAAKEAKEQAEEAATATETVSNDTSKALARVGAQETAVNNLVDAIGSLVQTKVLYKVNYENGEYIITDEALEMIEGSYVCELATGEEIYSGTTKSGEDVYFYINEKKSQMVYDEATQTWSFNTGAIDENIAKHNNDIEELKNDATNKEEVIKNLRDRFNEWADKIVVTTYENEPCLLLYEEGGTYKQYITNTRRIITETIDGTETVKSMVDIDTFIATESVQVGGFAWKKQGTNRIRLVWEGGAE